MNTGPLDVARAPPELPQTRRGRSASVGVALADLVAGARLFRLWGRLGWGDLRARHRETVLGPWWGTVSTGVTVVLVGGIAGDLFGLRAADHLPYVTAGLVVWGLLASLVGQASDVFTGSRRIVLQVALPLSLHVYRMVWRNVLAFAHTAVLLPIVAIAFGVKPGWIALQALAGLAAVCATGLWLGLALGPIVARYRDVAPVVAGLMRVAFLGTPIVWQPGLLRQRAWLAEWNPLHHLLDVVRAPLLGTTPAADSWLIVAGMTAVGCAAALAIFARCRGRIAFWL